MSKKLINLIIVLFLMAAGAWLRLANLGSVNFQNDEFFHVEAAQGYLATGHFVTWDQLHQQATDQYSRAWPYTWLVAQSFKLFGSGEWSGRLPAAVFGILLLPLIYWFSYKVTASRLAAVLALTLAVFDPSLIWSSRICRMYSAFIFFYLSSLIFIYYYWESKHKLSRIIYLIIGGGLFIVTYLFHETALLFSVCFLSYLLINSGYLFFIKKERGWNQNYVLTVLFFSFLVVAGIIHFFIHPLVIENYFSLRLLPNWAYLKYPFQQLQSYQIGWLVFVLGLFLWPRFNKMKIFLLANIFPVLIFFTFFADRYAAKKYILFIIPLVLILYSDGLVNLVNKIFTQRRYAVLSLIIIFILTGPAFSWPGLAVTSFTQLARADQTYDNFEYHDFKTAYQYLEATYQDQEPVLIQGAQNYYLTNPELNLITLKSNKEFSVKELKVYLSQNSSGWVIWPKYKEYHLKNEVVEYCQKNLLYQKDISAQTNLEIYRW